MKKLVAAHPDKFERSSSPKVGSVFSAIGHNHVGIVIAVKDNTITVQEGNLDGVSIPWWRSHPIHENRATESIWTEPCNPLLRATKSTKRATSIYEITLIFYLIFE